MDFCKLFNARTAKYKEGLELPVKLQAYNDRTFDFTVATPPASYFLKAAVRNPTPSQSVRVLTCCWRLWHHFVWASESKRGSDFVSHFERHECRPPQLVRSFLRALRRLCAPEWVRFVVYMEFAGNPPSCHGAEKAGDAEVDNRH